MKQRSREDPEEGDVMAVPLFRDRWGYLYCVGSMQGWLLGTVSRGLVRNVSKLKKSKRLQFYEKWGGWTVDCLTIGNIGYDHKRDYPAACYHDFGGADGLRRFRRPDQTGSAYITEEETKGLVQIFSTNSMRELRAEFESLLPQMEWLEGEPSAGPREAPPEQPEPETVDFEINELPPEDVEMVEEEALPALEAAGLGFECIGSSESGGNVALRGPAEEAKQALTVLRRLLRDIIGKEHHAHIEIERLGPGDRERRVFDLNGKVIPGA